MKKDVFICHSHDDKATVVRPLASCLNSKNISQWIDEAEILAGESISERVNEGLKISEYVIVILSRSFMSKKWAKRELWSVLNLEAKADRVILFPILVGTQAEVKEIVEEFPLLNDKLFLLWNNDPQRVASEIQRAIYKFRGEPHYQHLEMNNCGLCQTPFQYGVHICLGCQGRIIYGLTLEERAMIRKATATILSIFAYISMFHLPPYLQSVINMKVPMMWGIGFWAIPVATLFVIVGTFYVEKKLTKMKSHLIRTVR